MIVQWKQPNLVTVYIPGQDIAKGGQGFKVGQKILPGMNEIDEKDWNELKKHPILQPYIEQGDLVEIAKAKDSKGKEGIGAYEVKEAKTIIKGTFDKLLLKKWLQGESRDQVRAALQAQLEDIDKKTTKEKTEDDDDE